MLISSGAEIAAAASQRQQEPRGHPPDDEHGRGEDGQQHGGAEVRLQQGEPDRHGREQQGEGEPLPRRPAGAEDGGQHEQQPELGQLGRLEGEGADRDPAGRPVRRRTDREDADEEEDGRPVGAPAQDAEEADADAPEHRQRQYPARGDQGLPGSEVGGSDEVQVRYPERDQCQRGQDGEQVERAAATVPALLARRSRPPARRGRRLRRSGDRHRSPLPGAHPFRRAGRQEPTIIGGEAAAAGASVRATTATPGTGGSATMPTAAARSACGGTVIGSARRDAVALPRRAQVDDLERPGHDLWLHCRDEPHLETHGARRPRHTPRERAEVDGGHASRGGGGRGRDRRAGGLRRGDRLVPASPGVQEQADVGADVVAQEDDLRHDDRREDQDRQQPGADAPSGRSGPPRSARHRLGPRRCAPRSGRRTPVRGATDARERPHQSSELGTDRGVVDPRRPPPAASAATTGTPAVGRSCTARSSSARRWSAPGPATTDREPGGRGDVREDGVRGAPAGPDADGLPAHLPVAGPTRTTRPSAATTGSTTR